MMWMIATLMLLSLGDCAETPLCDKTLADANAGAGKCRIAKCEADDKYPPGCTRVSRYEMCKTCAKSEPNATVSSNDPPQPGICCKKMCHLEKANGDTCALLGAATDYASCVANGNPIMESFPEQCHDKLAGKTFTNIKATPGGPSMSLSIAHVPMYALLFLLVGAGV